MDLLADRHVAAIETPLRKTSSKSFMVIDLCAIRKHVYEFLLVLSCDLRVSYQVLNAAIKYMVAFIACITRAVIKGMFYFIADVVSCAIKCTQ